MDWIVCFLSVESSPFALDFFCLELLFYTHREKEREKIRKKENISSGDGWPMLIHHENEAGYVWLKKQIIRNGDREVSTSIKMRLDNQRLCKCFIFMCAHTQPHRQTYNIEEEEEEEVFFSDDRLRSRTCVFIVGKVLRNTRLSSGRDKSSESLFHYASRTIKGHIKANSFRLLYYTR